MCFYVSDRKIHKATRNIRCYKVVYRTGAGEYCSQMRAFKYTKGYHYYNPGFVKKVKNKTYLRGEGIHSYVSVVRYAITSLSMRNNYLRIIACTIPKGVYYMKNDVGEYISSDLIIRGEVTRKKVEKAAALTI